MMTNLVAKYGKDTIGRQHEPNYRIWIPRVFPRGNNLRPCCFSNFCALFKEGKALALAALHPLFPSVHAASMLLQVLSEPLGNRVDIFCCDKFSDIGEVHLICQTFSCYLTKQPSIVSSGRTLIYLTQQTHNYGKYNYLFNIVIKLSDTSWP